MPEIDPTRRQTSVWQRAGHSLSARLTLFLCLGLLITFAALGYLNVRLHRQHLEAATLTSAERVSDVIKRNANFHMLHNDREGLYHMIGTMSGEPGMVKVRIFDKEGHISFSSDAGEIGSEVDKKAEACYGCHAQAQPLTKLNRPDRFRIYRSNGGRVLGVINPIETRVECSSAPCHAHAADEQILGVLDTDLSLASADASLAQSSRHMIAYTLFAMLMIACVSGVFVWRMVGRPVEALKRGTERLTEGDLGYQIHTVSKDDLGDLAESFNQMSTELRTANDQIVAWTRTLEERVEEKTRELKSVHEHALHAEKLASIGKMAAVLAHEINNPLSGIMTYAKLLSKWVERDDAIPARRAEIREALNLIASESRRCGELVKNLLNYSRAAPINLETTRLNLVVERCVRLIQHRLELAGVQLQLQLGDIPPLQCDGNQIEQVLLALALNAIEAMPHGGNLVITTRASQDSENLELLVCDDGVGIAPELLPQIFEPFVSTKENGGTGLGLAVSRSIVERHNGSIAVQSTVGKGTTFTVTLPCASKKSIAVPAPVAAVPNGGD